MPRLVSGKTFVPGVCVNGHLVFLQQEVLFSFCPSVFLLQIQWPRTPPLSTHLALVTPIKDLISKHSHTEGQDRALVHEWGVGRETHRVDKAAVQQVSCMFAWERRRRVWHNLYSWQTEQALSDPSGKSRKLWAKDFVQALHVLSWYNCQTTFQNRYYYCCPRS